MAYSTGGAEALFVRAGMVALSATVFSNVATGGLQVKT